MSNILAIDFDGVIMRRRLGPIIGRRRRVFVPPSSESMPGAAEALKVLAQDWQLVCHSCRGQSLQGVYGVERWLKDRGLDELFENITCEKPLATAYIDDKAHPFTTWDEVLDTFGGGTQ